MRKIICVLVAIVLAVCVGVYIYTKDDEPKTDATTQSDKSTAGNTEPTTEEEIKSKNQTTEPMTDATEITVDIPNTWTIDTNKTDYTWLISVFGTSYRDYGCGLTIDKNGTISYYIGSTGGNGNYSVQDNTITANLISYADGDNMNKIFTIVNEDGTNYITLDIDGNTIWWVSKDSTN